MTTLAAPIPPPLDLAASAAPETGARTQTGWKLFRAGVVAALVGVVALQIWAGTLDYPLRVISDSPTFVALVADMASNPFASQSPYLAHGNVSTQHATPYTQLLAFAWRFLDNADGGPTAIGRLLALAGMAVFALTFCAVFAYVRRLAGSRAAWISLPVLLGLFGPAHVIWASDLTLHGALYAGFYPQNVALGLALLALLALERSSAATFPLAILASAATLVVHPFTGVLLGVLVTALAVQRARAGAATYAYGPLALCAGFGLGSLWPAYSLDRALGEIGVNGTVFVGVCAAVPVLVHSVPLPSLRRLRSAADLFDTRRTALLLAVVGAVGVVALSVWEFLLIESASTLASPRLSIYWIEDHWRWTLMFAAGTVGLLGLIRLARRGHLIPGVWFVGCFAIGVVGALGVPLPLWYRFLLLCQIPLAIGVAVVAAEAGRWTRSVIAATFLLALTVKIVTLVALPSTTTYLGSPLQDAWRLGDHVPTEPGIVATDPQTAYFIPAATGHKVLTITQGHVSSQYERSVSERGYQLLRRFYAGEGDWWGAAQQMWGQGVRYIVIDKHTTLEPRSLAQFTWQNATLRTSEQREALGRYFYGANRIGTLVYDSSEYVVYRLDPEKLFGS